MKFVVPEPKIVSYLLTNPRKREYFIGLGYSVQNWILLRDDILGLAQNDSMTFVRETEFGKKYQIVGNIRAPDGRMVRLTTGWMVLNGDTENIRFVTAYPASSYAMGETE